MSKNEQMLIPLAINLEYWPLKRGECSEGKFTFTTKGNWTYAKFQPLRTLSNAHTDNPLCL